MAEVIDAFRTQPSHPEQFSESELYGPLSIAETIRNARRLSLGARLVGNGVAEVAIRTSSDVLLADFCLLRPDEPSDPLGRSRLHRVGASRDGGNIFAGRIRAREVREGTPYGFRVMGTYNPPFQLPDYRNLLLDPYGRSIVMHAHSGNSYEPFPERPYSYLTDTSFNWGNDRPPKIDPAKRVIYETHVKGLSMNNPNVPERLRGTYAGAAHPATIAHLKKLNVTSVEFLPLQEKLSESHYQPGRLPNYWGYNTIGFFAPQAEYAENPHNATRECKTMVKALHAAGIEVFLDVVYNHTGEGGAAGPVLSFKGLDNDGIYRVNRDGNYVDYTGCGNTLDLSRPAALDVVVKSMRYWAEEMGIDGFRLDLATALVRDRQGNIAVNGPFTQSLQRDKVLRKLPIFPEPWDATWGSVRTDEFARQRGMQPWNGDFRDNVRRFWNGLGADINDLSRILAGSGGKVNFVTAHDGFTLPDLVSYNGKHNWANKEDNTDGTDDNNSNNYGVEDYKTSNPEVHRMRRRAAANMLGTLALADGTPMLLGGDEMWRTQQGNNNAYCQDNELSWLPWRFDEDAQYMQGIVQALFRIRREHDRAGGLTWLNIWGEPMKDHEWHNGVNVVGALWAPRRVGKSILYWVNGTDTMMNVSLPQPAMRNRTYLELVNTATEEITLDRPSVVPATSPLAPFSSRILRSN